MNKGNATTDGRQVVAVEMVTIPLHQLKRILEETVRQTMEEVTAERNDPFLFAPDNLTLTQIKEFLLNNYQRKVSTAKLYNLVNDATIQVVEGTSPVKVRKEVVRGIISAGII